jgi:hypothetical protein
MIKKKSEIWNLSKKLALAPILAASVFSQHAVAKSIDPAPLLKSGRQNLAKQTSDGIAAAHQNFSSALKAAPNNTEANLLYSITLFLKEHSARDLHDQIQAGGIGLIDPSPYAFEFSYPMDRQGRFAPFRYAGTKQTLSYFDSKTALCNEALACLQKIKDPKFRTVLTERETSLLGVTVDYGDVQLLRAALQLALAGLDLAKAYNFEAEYFWIYKRAITPGLAPEMISKAYPQALGFTTQSAIRFRAKTKLIAANAEIQSAHDFIKKSRKPSNPQNLVEVLDGGTADDLANFCKALAQSLNGQVKLPNAKNWQYDIEDRQINLAKLFDSPSAPRTYLPDKFDRGFIQPGSWKDRTMGGLFPDLKIDELDALALEYGVLQNTSLEPYTFTTISGRAGLEGYMGSNSTALYGDLRGLTVDSAGNIYVADGRNHVIRKITPQGKVSDVVGKRWVTQREVDKLWNNYSKAGKFEEASGIFYYFNAGPTLDSTGNICFVADGLLYKWTASGKLVHFAGSWDGQVRNGKGKSARFANPTYIAAGKNGTLYVSDETAVRKVDASANVTTFAGKLDLRFPYLANYKSWGYANGAASVARFHNLGGIAVDGAENVFVFDQSKVIRKISSNGTTSAFAGTPADDYDDPKPFDAVGSKARFGEDGGPLAIDKNGNLFLAAGELIRKITPQAKVTTIGGKYRNYGRRDGVGEAALFGDSETRGIAVDVQGRVFIADEVTVRRGVALKSLPKTAK